MVNIDLTPQQIEELKKYYESELEQMRKRTDEFQRLLIKLDTKYSFDAKSSVPADKNEIKPLLTKLTSKKTIKIKPRKTKNPNWRHFILTSLNEQNKPLSLKEFFKSYKRQYGIDASTSKTSGMALSQALYRLRVKDNIVKSFRINGKKEKVYGLIDNADKTVLLTDNAKAKKPIKLKPNQKPKTVTARENKPPLVTTYNWPQFIFDTLNKTKRVLSASDFVRHAMVHFNIPKRDFEATRIKVSPALSNLDKNLKKLKTIKKAGQAARFYGLPEWFDYDNKLIVKYK